MKLITSALSLLFVTVCFTVQAQQATVNSGGIATGSGGTITYSVGIPVYSSITSSLGAITQGVQQSYMIKTLSTEHVLPSVSMAVFPNPTTNNITLSVNDGKINDLKYQVYDIQGKRIFKENITSLKTTIPFFKLSPSVYFIKIIHKNNIVKAFKIIKN
ncbi:T9SS type A sorting domain-containing protein [Polaribacter tangerinus]|uniref:T9SS type A sorting domain-containing protein n=1 Tax=Polaribacter tangerinus TaxID=1920034 RepID=UPI000B4B68E0|nr:T9SS type A sorting domain-containing protein [Polaribacter tangerinus]